jgi:hypothetical protein
MKKTYLAIIALVIATATIITGCEQEAPISNTEALNVQIQVVGIDSVSAARTEDKYLLVNIK